MHAVWNRTQDTDSDESDRGLSQTSNRNSSHGRQIDRNSYNRNRGRHSNRNSRNINRGRQNSRSLPTARQIDDSSTALGVCNKDPVLGINNRRSNTRERDVQVARPLESYPGNSRPFGNYPGNRDKSKRRDKPHIVQQAEAYELPRNVTDKPDPTKQQHGANNDSNKSETKQQEQKARNSILGFKKLNELVTKPNNEILLSLCLPTSGLKEFLDKVNGEQRNMMSIFLTVLSKCCDSLLKINVLSLISLVTQNRMFMYCALQQYLVGFQFDKNGADHSASVKALLKLLDTFQNSLPASASEIVPVLLPHIKLACNKIFVDSELLVIKEHIKELEGKQQNFIKDHTKVEIKTISFAEDHQAAQPPENYREIPILPTRKDVTEITPFLRPNVIKGKYADGEHYLDVQFRLLREDYIRPLRDGISMYKRFNNNKKYSSKNKDVRIYQDVHITQQEFLNGCLIHIVKFDIAKFAHVNWEHSKRFLTGSLLCFSSDDFDTFFFASVVARDCNKLKEGVLLLKLEELSPEALNISPLQTFVMLETTAYFEAYRHNLAALHNMSGDDFPFEKYIVSIDANVEHPSYLSKSTTYDIGQMFHSIKRDYELKNVQKIHMNVLDELHWPTHKDFGFDPSQMEAFKTAITKEFAIIQGPPGTGKTYVGLRIVQLLLHNSCKWSHEINPILIVCYTNHALDQFLEGIKSFTHQIVRVGGRCSNESIEKYKLSNLKKVVREKREVPHHIFSSVRFQLSQLHELKTHINKIMNDMKRCSNTVLSQFELQLLMKVEHYSSLTSFVLSNSDFEYGMTISHWLGVHSQLTQNDSSFNDILGNLSMEDVQTNAEAYAEFNRMASTANQSTFVLRGNNSQSILNPGPENIMPLDSDGDGEDDIEFIEGMRDVDAEDFSHVNIDNLNDSDWQVEGAQQKSKQFIAEQLQDVIPFTEAEEQNISNVWQLDANNRWRLYKYWVQKYIHEKQIELVQLQTEIQNEFQKLNEMKTEEDLYLLRKASIVAMTTTGAAKYRDLVQNIKPKIVIIEEAAEILEAHIITTLVEQTQHVILIGDHQQLRPNPNVYDLAVRYNLNVSLFERLVKNGMGYCKLALQHRMRPEIAELLVPHIYSDLCNHESVLRSENIKGVEKNVFFVSHDFIESNEQDSASRVNEHEAKFIVKLCRYLLLQGYDSSRITILTTYSGQLFALKRLAKADIMKGVRITIVDNFQGEENDIILISFVRSNLEGNIGFLKVSNRICVALSRAKKGLFCIGNFNLLSQNSEVWKNIMATLQRQRAIGGLLRLQCQNHPKVFTNVATEQDFNQVPEGGCMLPCEFRVPCGHTCSRTCHSYDREHEKFQCRKACEKRQCELGHKCAKLCFQECGPCTQKVLKALPQCQHEVKIPCHVNPHDFSCTEDCTKQLPCGHKCTRFCGQICLPDKCHEEVEVILPCHHKNIVRCSESRSTGKLLKFCNEPCDTLLGCGHVCGGSCGRCQQQRLHQICRKVCKRILVCGHECKSLCSNFCPPCKQKCDNRCHHSKCPKQCGEPCKTCKEPCEWACDHVKCDKLCGELCSREPCDHSCKKMLKCRHPCIGLCGEPCPNLCAICDSEKVKEIFFGTEDDADARFVQLEECGHVLEVEGLTHWMTKSVESGEIQMKCCPKCKTVIRKNLRFGNVVKTSLSTVEQVKQLIYGDEQKNEANKQVLIQNLNSLVVHSDFQMLLKPMLDCLKKRKRISNPFMITCENVFRIAHEFLSIKQKKDVSNSRYAHSVLKNFIIFIDATEKLIFDLIRNEYSTASAQQIQDITRELLRYKAQIKVISFLRDNYMLSRLSDVSLSSNAMSNTKTMDHLQRGIDCLIALKPFDVEHEKKYEESFKNMVKSCSSSVINVTEDEKKVILKAMNLSQGHWYQCPNGHVYCITECGGAMVESKCNECGAEIGGADHRLRSDNRVASDMDGARHAAWSEMANMQNYNIQDDI